MCVCVCVCVYTQSCLTPCDPKNCSPPASSVHGIFQARELEWGAISYSAIVTSSLYFFIPYISDTIQSLSLTYLLNVMPSKSIHISVVVQPLSCVWLFATPWTAARQASLSFTISRSLLKLMSIELAMPSNHLILCHPLLLLLSIFPSISVFSNESTLRIRWPKYWHFSISPSNEYSGLISFRIDWFDLLAVQGFSRVFSSTTVWKH